MDDLIKLDLKTSRKNVLLLNSIIELGLSVKNPDDKSINLSDVVPKESLKELSILSGDCLGKAGLTELSQKLKVLKGEKCGAVGLALAIGQPGNKQCKLLSQCYNSGMPIY